MMAREDADLIDAIERFEELLLEFMTPLWRISTRPLA